MITNRSHSLQKGHFPRKTQIRKPLPFIDKTLYNAPLPMPFPDKTVQPLTPPTSLVVIISSLQLGEIKVPMVGRGLGSGPGLGSWPEEAYKSKWKVRINLQQSPLYIRAAEGEFA